MFVKSSLLIIVCSWRTYRPYISMILRYFLITSLVCLAVFADQTELSAILPYCEIVQCETPCRGSIVQCENSSD